MCDLRVDLAKVDPTGASPNQVIDLNPHLIPYDATRVAQARNPAQ